MKQTLEQRPSSAFADTSSFGAAQIAQLIAETESAIQYQTTLADEASVRALDDLDVPAAEANQRAATMKLQLDRYHIAVHRMRERLAQATAKERQEKWMSRAQRLAAEVDVLGAELADRYPRLIYELVNLFQRCIALDRRVNELNIEVPAGAAPVKTAEMLARGVNGFTTASPSIVASTVLVDHNGKQIWPLAKPMISTLVQLPVIEGAGPRWAEERVRQGEERNLEWERVTQFHAEQAKQRQEREEQEDKAKIEADRAARQAHHGHTAA